MSEKILVTGASGFIAGHCILDLLEHGYQVRGTVRNLKKVPELRKMFAKYTDKADSIEFAQADLLSSDGWAEAMAGCDGLFHLASPVPLVQPKDPDEVIVPAREGALNALRAANEAGIKRVVLTSSVAAVMYGHKEKSRVFNEHDWTNLDAPNLPAYFQSKTIAEKAAWDYVEGTDIELSTVHPGVVLGPALESDYGTSLQLLVELLKGKYPLIPKVGFEIVDVRDVAILHRLAYEAPEAGKRLLCANGFTKFKDVARTLKKAYPDANVPNFEMPNLMFSLLSPFLKDMEMVRGEANKVKAADISAAKAIGWKPRSVEEAILSGAKKLKELGVV
jgi:nucleoside-diphosphate-sugar epimerase